MIINLIENYEVIKSFRKLKDSKYEKGQNAIICTVDKVSIISD